MRALLVVDMIYDFVYGKFGTRDAQDIISVINILASKFDTVIFLRDAHHPGDPELEVWGEHAMAGTKGSEIVAELKDLAGTIVDKDSYNGFSGTELDEVLRAQNVDEVYICGVATDICVIHTAFGAFRRGYKVHIIKDACAGTSEEAHSRALEYMRNIYGAQILESDML